VLPTGIPACVRCARCRLQGHAHPGGYSFPGYPFGAGLGAGAFLGMPSMPARGQAPPAPPGAAARPGEGAAGQGAPAAGDAAEPAPARAQPGAPAAPAADLLRLPSGASLSAVELQRMQSGTSSRACGARVLFRRLPPSGAHAVGAAAAAGGPEADLARMQSGASSRAGAYGEAALPPRMRLGFRAPAPAPAAPPPGPAESGGAGGALDADLMRMQSVNSGPSSKGPSAVTTASLGGTRKARRRAAHPADAVSRHAPVCGA